MKYLHASALLVVLAFLTSGALAQKSMGGMENMGAMGTMTMGKKPEAAVKGTHQASGTVKKLNQQTGVVTLSHGPVATLSWPAMTMGFKVNDKALLPRLTEGRKVEFEFMKEGDDYVITNVK